MRWIRDHRAWLIVVAWLLVLLVAALLGRWPREPRTLIPVELLLATNAVVASGT